MRRLALMLLLAVPAHEAHARDVGAEDQGVRGVEGEALLRDGERPQKEGLRAPVVARGGEHVTERIHRLRRGGVARSIVLLDAAHHTFAVG